MQIFYGRFRLYNEFLNPGKSDVILSVGCKGAYFESCIRDRVMSIHGIDIDRAEIERNRKKEPRISFECCDITGKSPFPDGHFNKVIFNEVIEHLPEGAELKALKEINRVMKRNGTLLMSTPNDHPLSKFSDPVWWLKNHRHYKAGKIKNMLEESGFEVEKEFIGGSYLQSITMPFLYLLSVFHHYTESSMERLVDHEYDEKGFWTLIIKAKKIRNV